MSDKVAISTYLLIITSNVSKSNAPSKDMAWLNGQNQSHACAAYKRLTSDRKTQTE